jgi:catechol 2,3-dioxygenase-like lactoylglutathione lyase family enzyme
MVMKALAHACILSNDLDKTQQFYCEALGLRHRFDFMRNGERVGYYLEITPGQYLEVFHTTAQNQALGHQRLHHLCFEVEDVQDTIAQLEHHGVPTRDLKMGADHSWQFWCSDPDGTDLEFQQYTEHSTQHTGETVHLVD